MNPKFKLNETVIYNNNKYRVIKVEQYINGYDLFYDLLSEDEHLLLTDIIENQIEKLSEEAINV